MAGGDNGRHLISIESEGELENKAHQWTEVLSLKPRAFIYHDFLSKKECEHVISLAKPHLTRSRVHDVKIPEGKISSARTSFGMFLWRGQDKVIMDIEKRIAEYTTIPIEQGSRIQVLHYETGQKFDPHYDYFSDEINTKNGGQRMATLVMYLSDVEEGGETIFPEAKGNNLMSCDKRGLSMKPKMGDALLFWNLHPDLTVDPSSFHGSCPVKKGSKWAATKWMHVKEFKV